MSSSQSVSPDGGAIPEPLNLELVRQCVDVLRLITEQLRPAPPPVAVSAPGPPPPVARTPVWQGADTFLAARTWQADPIVALWVYPCYVYGLHLVLAMGGTLTGHRCLLGVTEAASEDQPHLESWLADVATRGVTADQGLLCIVPGGVAVPAAVRTVWGPTVAIQQCLNATLTAVTSGLSADQAAVYRHRLRLAWMRLELQQAEDELHDLG